VLWVELKRRHPGGHSPRTQRGFLSSVRLASVPSLGFPAELATPPMTRMRPDSGIPLTLASAAIAFGVGVAHAQVARPSGSDVYAKHCASCHDQVGARIPTREALSKMSPARILRTLDFGLMMSIAYPMRRDEREAVAKFLGTGADEMAPLASAFC